MMYIHEWIWDATQPQAVLLLVHGAGEHCGRYASFAATCNEQNLSVIGFDLPGHGRSEGRRGHIDAFEQYIQTVDQLFARCQTLYPNLPIILFGHSMGGLIVVRYMQTRTVPAHLSAVILSSPCLQLSLQVPAIKILMTKILNNLWPTLTQPSGVRAEHVSRSAAITHAYTNDALVVNVVSVRWFVELQNAMTSSMQTSSLFPVPTLVMQAGQDKLVSPATTQQFVDALRAPEKVYRLYKDCYHELLNEPEASDICEEMFSWLIEQLHNA